MNKEFVRFIQLEGNQAKASQFLGITESMVSRMKTGDRRVSVEHAEKISLRYPEISFSRLLLNKQAA